MKERRTFEFLNVMRFVSAAWVVLAHLGAPPLDSLVAGSHAQLVRKALIAPFSGVAAVMVFFLISGFCIHYPHLTGKPFAAVSFWLQRFVRIGVPLLAAVLIHRWWGTERWLRNMLWAVYCEMIYYALYPLLRIVMEWAGTLRLVVGSLVASWLFCLIPDTGYGHIFAYGNAWTWLVCLPVWLGGCLLANWIANGQRLPTVMRVAEAWIDRHLVMARWMIWGLSSLLLVFGMKEIFPFKYSLPAFGVMALPWFFAEMNRPDQVSWISRLGLCGYSIYLMHAVALPVEGAWLFAGLHPLAAWSLRIVVIAGVCCIFYLAIELPSHRLARKLGAWWHDRAVRVAAR